MQNKYDLTKAVDRKLLQNDAMAAFVKEMHAGGHKAVKFGGTVMPREQWAIWLAMAIAEVEMLGNPDGIACILQSPVGNTSQLGMLLVEEGHLTREEVAQAATSLADMLAARAKAKQAGTA